MPNMRKRTHPQVRGEMDLAYHGEITTPSQCGRMDQCCAFGPRPVLMTFDGDRLDCDELSLKVAYQTHQTQSDPSDSSDQIASTIQASSRSSR